MVFRVPRSLDLLLRVYVHSHIAQLCQREFFLIFGRWVCFLDNCWSSIELLYFCPHKPLEALLVDWICDYHHGVLLLMLLQILTLTAYVKVFTLHAHVSDSFERFLAGPTCDPCVVGLGLQQRSLPQAVGLRLP